MNAVEQVADSILTAIEFKLTKAEADVIAKAAIQALIDMDWPVKIDNSGYQSVYDKRVIFGAKAMLKQMLEGE